METSHDDSQGGSAVCSVDITTQKPDVNHWFKTVLTHNSWSLFCRREESLPVLCTHNMLSILCCRMHWAVAQPLNSVLCHACTVMWHDCSVTVYLHWHTYSIYSDNHRKHPRAPNSLWGIDEDASVCFSMRSSSIYFCCNFVRISLIAMNEWILIGTCKQLVWSIRIGRNMPIWVLWCSLLCSRLWSPPRLREEPLPLP
jgi:hypothetical protein